VNTPYSSEPDYSEPDYSEPDYSEPGYSETARPPVTPSPAQPRNGLGVTALVLGVASLVAAISFVLFPLALLGGLVAIVLGLIAMARGRTTGATNSGQAAAGLICGILALAISIVFAVRVGTFVERNTTVFTSFDKCIAQASNRSEVSTCISRFANDIRP
jgi:membrane-bound ClpP family serine protease